ncbi:MAG: hypothetical protein ACPGUV_06485 [Polyangiales bacterium]
MSSVAAVAWWSAAHHAAGAQPSAAPDKAESRPAAIPDTAPKDPADAPPSETETGDGNAVAGQNVGADTTVHDVEGHKRRGATETGSGTPSAATGAATGADLPPAIAKATQPAATPAAPAPAKTPPPPKWRTGPGLTVFAGVVSGVGLGYRQHFGRLGVQVGGLPAAGEEVGFANGGAQLMVTFLRRAQARMYALAGFGVFYSYDESVVPEEERRLDMWPGAGIGLALNTEGGFFMALELPFAVRLSRVDRRYRSDEFIALPVPAGSLGFYF